MIWFGPFPKCVRDKRSHRAVSQKIGLDCACVSEKCQELKKTSVEAARQERLGNIKEKFKI